jgi:hypothetical protein
LLRLKFYSDGIQTKIERVGLTYYDLKQRKPLFEKVLRNTRLKVASYDLMVAEYKPDQRRKSEQGKTLAFFGNKSQFLK